MHPRPSDQSVPKLKRYCIKTDAVSAERVWDFAQQNQLKIYGRGHTTDSARKYEYEVYMHDEVFLAFKLTHRDIRIFPMDKPEVEDTELLTTHYIEVSLADMHDYMVKISRLLDPACVVQLSSRSPKHRGNAKIKVIVTQGSEEENLLLLTYGHLESK